MFVLSQGPDDSQLHSWGGTVLRWCTVQYVLYEHDGWPVHVSGDREWTSVQELFEAKLKPSIQSIVLALICCPPRPLSVLYHSCILVFMNGMCQRTRWTLVDIRIHGWSKDNDLY